MKPTVLIVEDEPGIADTLQYALRTEGCEPAWCATGEAALARIAASPPALVILDVGLPDINGFELFKQLREVGDVPVVFLTARSDEIDRVVGLELGADDYVPKPFSTRVLLARVQSLLRREAHRMGTPTENPPLVQGDLQLDPERLEVKCRGTPITVTVTEFRLLEILARKPGIVFSRSRLLEQLRGDDTVVVERIIDTYVRRLRRKIEAVDSKFDRIETVIGAGYRWKDG
jgi:DNA-binding response OmpR family regulator